MGMLNTRLFTEAIYDACAEAAFDCSDACNAWFVHGSNDETIEIRRVEGARPYFVILYKGETVQCECVDDGIKVVVKHARFAQLLADMCTTNALLLHRSVSAGTIEELKRELVIGDWVLTVTNHDNTLYSGQIIDAHSPQTVLWSLPKVTVNELFEKAKEVIDALLAKRVTVRHTT